MRTYGIKHWADAAARMTGNAAIVKGWRLTRKHDRQMKEIAQDLARGRGYVIATDRELADRYPGMLKVSGPESKPMIWAVHFCSYAHGNKMSFMPIR